MPDGQQTKKIKVKQFHNPIFASSVQDLKQQLEEKVHLTEGESIEVSLVSQGRPGEPTPPKGYDWEVSFQIPTPYETN